MVLPVGFGKIYINEVVLGSIRKSGMDVLNSQAPGAMLIPAAGMLTGLLIAIFFPTGSRGTTAKAPRIGS